MKKKVKREQGFTLIELIVILGILVILIAFLVPNFMGYLDQANKTSQDAAAKTVYTSIMAGATAKSISLGDLAGRADDNPDKLQIMSQAALAANLDDVKFTSSGSSKPTNPSLSERVARAYIFSSTAGTNFVTVFASEQGEFTVQVSN